MLLFMKLKLCVPIINIPAGHELLWGVRQTFENSNFNALPTILGF
jgi:hypothetical protein